MAKPNEDRPSFLFIAYAICIPWVVFYAVCQLGRLMDSYLVR